MARLVVWKQSVLCLVVAGLLACGSSGNDGGEIGEDCSNRGCIDGLTCTEAVCVGDKIVRGTVSDVPDRTLPVHVAIFAPDVIEKRLPIFDPALAKVRTTADLSRTPAPFFLATAPVGRVLLFAYQVGEPSLQWPVAFGAAYVEVDDEGAVTMDGTPVTSVSLAFSGIAKLP